MLKIITKSAVFSSVTFWLWFLSNQLALAQAKCTVNGREVPCEELGKQIKGFLGGGLVFFLVVAAILIWAMVFWIMMIVHVARHEVQNKAVWIILMVLTGIVGALIYYFVVKRKFGKKQAAQPPTVATPQ